MSEKGNTDCQYQTKCVPCVLCLRKEGTGRRYLWSKFWLKVCLTPTPSCAHWKGRPRSWKMSLKKALKRLIMEAKYDWSWLNMSGFGWFWLNIFDQGDHWSWLNMFDQGDDGRHLLCWSSLHDRTLGLESALLSRGVWREVGMKKHFPYFPFHAWMHHKS